MTFTNARCEICGKDQFKIDGLIAYRINIEGKVERVLLGGKQPWSGIRVICMGCCEFIIEAWQ